MPHDAALESETRAWLLKAAKDLAMAVHDRAASPPFLEDVVFHSQQAVEKAIKAFLTWRGIAFRAKCVRKCGPRPRLRAAGAGIYLAHSRQSDISERLVR